MLPTIESLLRVAQWVRWKQILILIIFPISIRFLFFEVHYATVESKLSSAISTLGLSSNLTSGSGYQSTTGDSTDDGDEYVAVCIAVKDVANDLVEFFVHHYHHMGIRRFYVMDDGSEPPLSDF